VHAERRRTVPPRLVDAATLTDLYVTQRLDDAEIGSRCGVPAWRVTKRRRELGVHRPVSTVVRAWLTDAGIPVKPRTSREHRKHLDPVLIAELYQEREWSSAQIAAHQDVTVNLVLRTLHDHGVPVRHGGPPPRHPDDDEMDPRLTALYADPEITTLLRRHRIPRRNQPGTITERFPTAAPVTEAFLREAYVDIGLATTHIEQLTGQPMERILSLMHAHAIPVRPPSFSPWLVRQRQQSRTQNLGSKRAAQTLIRRR